MKHSYPLPITVIALLLVSCASYSQINKGSLLLGGQLSFYSDTWQQGSSEQKNSAANIGISLGKAFRENTVYGINLGVIPYNKQNYYNGTDTVNINTTRYEAGLFYRKYKVLAKDFYLFGQFDGAFVTGRQEQENPNSTMNVTTKETGGYLSFTPGLSYQVMKKLQLEITLPNVLGLRYLSSKTESEDPQSTTLTRDQFSFYSNISSNSNLGFLGVGFRFIL